jgi:hypothetical protein
MKTNDGNTPPQPRPAWTLRELLAWLAVALLAVGIYLQHRRLEKMQVELGEQTQATCRAAETHMIERLNRLGDRVQEAEQKVRGCIEAADKAAR